MLVSTGTLLRQWKQWTVGVNFNLLHFDQLWTEVGVQEASGLCQAVK